MDFLERAAAKPVLHGQGRRRQDLVACATAVALADRGRRVLLVSTDPASNLDEVLETTLGAAPTADPGGARALRAEHRPGGGGARLPRADGRPVPRRAARGRGAQHRGAALGRLHRGDRRLRRVLEAARRRGRDGATSTTSSSTPRRPGTRCACSSCPRRGRGSSRATSAARRASGRSPGSRRSRRSTRHRVAALVDGERTALVLVSRAERAALAEAERTRRELAALGVQHQELVLNGVFRGHGCPATRSPSRWRRGRRGACARCPPGCVALPRTELPLAALRARRDGRRCARCFGPSAPSPSDSAPRLPQRAERAAAARRTPARDRGAAGAASS